MSCAIAARTSGRVVTGPGISSSIDLAFPLARLLAWRHNGRQPPGPPVRWTRCRPDMNLPVPLPDWLPWWVPVVVLVPALLYGLLFLLMPFSVFGLKGRLDVIEARIDELHADVRSLTLRLPERDPERMGADMGDDRPRWGPPVVAGEGRAVTAQHDEPPPVPPR